ncbi:TPA: hypothetical protein DIS56_03245 [Candidatus Saccharibacteria bacterium]|nr:MAG: hypothetical protein A3F05_01180 [Candidatus Saccharibacteria bacterium RIFCSPHIGHO2_12_FULL_47_17]HCM52117.1 hypothetical protein [Candidatus Saccharibacteria bacterium]
MREIWRDRRVVIPTVILALSGVSFGISYEVGSRIKKAPVAEFAPENPICLIPIIGQMAQIRKESKETNTPICDEEPMRPVTISIPKELFEPVVIPPMAKK